MPFSKRRDIGLKNKSLGMEKTVGSFINKGYSTAR
jgi:hypothetical protein